MSGAELLAIVDRDLARIQQPLDGTSVPTDFSTELLCQFLDEFFSDMIAF